MAVGNDRAGAQAKEGRFLHPPVPIELRSQLDFYFKRAPLVAKAVGTTLSLFQPMSGNMGRVPRPRNVAEAIRAKQHH